MPEQDEDRHSPRTLESLVVYVRANFESLRKDVQRVLAVIEERQIEKEVALLAERQRSAQEAVNAQKSEVAAIKAELDDAKKWALRWLLGALVTVLFAIAGATLTIVFKLK